jgi:2-polyprenyl-3-methyl-5-hydroxy-6-metoxy-1,4-benzoquinol methylase
MWHARLARSMPVDRRDFIIEQCRGKRVLHLGCVDHPLLEEQLASGALLHAVLASSAAELCGVDLDGEGLAKLRSIGYQDLIEGNIEQLASLVGGRRFDVVLAAEIMEHLDNPGSFLDQVPRCLAVGGLFIATVPSATSIRIFANTLRHREVVHPDHNAYYSPRTLEHLLRTHHFEVADMRPYWTPVRKRPLFYSAYDRMLRLAARVSPWLGEGIVVAARPVVHSA